MITMTMQEFDAHPARHWDSNGHTYLLGMLTAHMVEIICDADATAISEAQLPPAPVARDWAAEAQMTYERR